MHDPGWNLNSVRTISVPLESLYSKSGSRFLRRSLTPFVSSFFFFFFIKFPRMPNRKKSRRTNVKFRERRRTRRQLKASHGFSRGRLKRSCGLLRNTPRLVPKDIIYRQVTFVSRQDGLIEGNLPDNRRTNESW